MPRLLDQLFCLKLKLQAELSSLLEEKLARPHPTHRISVGRDGAAAPGNDLYVSMQLAD